MTHFTNNVNNIMLNLVMENWWPASRFERFDLIEIASLLANQPVASKSERARDQCRSATVTPPVNLSYSFLSPHISCLYCYRQLTVSLVVTATAIFRRVDNNMPNRLQLVHWPSYKLKPFAISNRDTGYTLPTSVDTELNCTVNLHNWQKCWRWRFEKTEEERI